jgi:hypothetical protein
LSEQHAVEGAVMASEIEQLPDLCGLLKVASKPKCEGTGSRGWIAQSVAGGIDRQFCGDQPRAVRDLHLLHLRHSKRDF